MWDTGVRQLKSSAERERFRQAYNRSFEDRGIAVKTPMTRAEVEDFDEVYVIIRRKRWVGGFVKNDAPKRIARFSELGQLSMPSEIRTTLRGVELTAVWKRHGVKGQVIWPSLLGVFWKMDLRGQKIITAAYGNHGMYGTYMLFQPEILYPARSPQELSVFAFSKAQFAATVVAGTWQRFRWTKSVGRLLGLPMRKAAP